MSEYSVTFLSATCLVLVVPEELSFLCKERSCLNSKSWASCKVRYVRNLVSTFSIPLRYRATISHILNSSSGYHLLPCAIRSRGSNKHNFHSRKSALKL